MKTYLIKIKAYIIKHKIISAIFFIGILFLGYWGYGKLTSTTGETQYITTTVQKGTIVSSVTASGQVESSNQIDLKTRATGQIVYVGAKAGDIVKKGKTLFSLDARDAQQAVRNAQTSLETAKLDLEKFQQPPDSVAVLVIKKAIADAEASKLDAEKAITDAYRALLNTSVVASPVNSSDTQTAPTISGTYIKDKEVVITISVYQTGNGAYFNATSVPVGVVSGSGNVTTVTPQPIGDSGLYIKFATASSNQSNWIITLPNKSATTYNANYTTYQDAIDNQKKVDDTADLTIAQNNKSLNDLYQPDALTLRTKQLAVKQAQDTLSNDQIVLSDYYVIAPFDGIIASVTGKVGDTASGTLGTIITNQEIALLSMNEVDVAKIKLGQKATITFDAIPDLSMTGSVVEIDTIGTVSQGVVSYSVKIAFDTEDAQVKPGMSVSASIITDSKTDVLLVPSSAIKTQGTTKYVQIFSTPLAAPLAGSQGTPSVIAPNQIAVETGLTDDTNTEIISGLKEGDQIVSRTITSTTTTTKAPTTTSLLGGAGARGLGGGGGGGNFGR
ncbi:MAG: efflux RND transporter periplasmic adaptor subunit [Candidatus Nomurabacteria bacterium]|nr:efflux RND transporter periplasmic adaptor subunit [Candidatus Nomurabacteria bacterium]